MMDHYEREVLIMKLNAFRSMWLGLVLAALLSMPACGDYSIQLPGKYALIRVYAGAVLISHPEMEIGPLILKQDM